MNEPRYCTVCGQATLPLEHVAVPRAELDRLLDSDRIAWAFINRMTYRDAGELRLFVEAKGWIKMGDGTGNLNDAARAIIDAAREGRKENET